MMPRCAPNEEMASLFVPTRRVRGMRMACGVIDCFDLHPASLASAIDETARDRHRLADAMNRSYSRCPTWAEWRPKYLRRMEELL
jgi:hypothetical protein